MEKYVTQLLEILQAAEENKPAPTQIDLPEEMEGLREIIEMERSLKEDEQLMENIFGVPQYYFPPEDRLSDKQVELLKEGILRLWKAFNYEADFRRGEFNDREQYSKLVEKWKEYAPILRGTNGTWHFEMFDYDLFWDEEEMKYVTEEEYFKKFRL